jgi:predicted RNA binding protein YcfA (HicA-like mRNA interferase family)
MDLKGELDSLKQRRKSVRPQEMHALLAEAGFDHQYGKGNHWVYTHPRRHFPLTIDPRNPLLPAYVSKAIRAIEEVLADESDEADENA